LRAVRVWRRLLGVQYTMIEGVELERVAGEEVVVARVRPTRSRTAGKPCACAVTGRP
jgi:hypothetical protein